jgi:ABC-type multidrug transport system ATPase subunit
MSAAIQVRELRKVYRPGSTAPVTALDGLDLEIPAGEIFGLLGPNGAGKSTLVKILSTITQPTSGAAAVNGFDVVSQPLEVRRSIAVVLQATAAEMFLSVQENLVSYALFRGLSRRDALRQAQETAELFGLTEHLEEKAQDLSGGYRRRVQVAKTFLVETPVLFLDEASAGMDPVVKRQVVEHIRERARRGTTILLTTQILTEAEELCDHIAILSGGRIKAAGDLPTLKLLAREAYDLTLTFGEITPEVLSFFSARNPVKIEQQGNTLFVGLAARESEVLELLAEAARRWTMLHFEVAGASLEDVFVEVLKKES